ncbi:MAG: DUF4230 domain-containing protein [Solobacterium sp.]|nr:DUF4230 domain-containing protein [Solobacterium sp.]
MAENKPGISVNAKAETVSNEKTEKQKREAEEIRRRIENDNLKAEQARKEAEEKRRQAEEEARRKKEEAERKAEEERRAAEEAARKAENDKRHVMEAGTAIAAAAITAASRNKGGRFRSFLIGLVIGLIAGAVIMYSLFKPAEPKPVTTITPAESADVIIDQNFATYTAADFQDAVLGAASDHQELIVMEQPLSIITTVTKAGLGGLPVFSKVKNITYYGTGVYTTDLSHIDRDHISVDEKEMTVTVTIPHTVLQYVNPDLNSTEFEDTEKGLLAFGDIKMTAEEQNILETSVYDAMKERLDSEDLYAQADTLAKLKTYEIFQPLITAVSPQYKVITELE